MAGSLADYAEKATIDWLLGGATPTRPAALFLALYTAAPGDTGGGTEVAGNGYARQTITFAAAVIGNGSNGAAAGTTQAVHSNTPSFTAAGGDWGTIVSFAVFDAATGGNAIFFASMTVSRQVKDGDTLSFPAGQISLAQD